MRSLIPLIAGMMHMNQWHFLLANIISAFGWAFLYVTPGILIGAASSELSAESATHLIGLILLMLAIIWIGSLCIKWLLVHTNHILRVNLHDFWTLLKHHPRTTNHTKRLTPSNELNHYPTAALAILCFLCFLISITTVILVLQESWVATINNPVYLFLQSLRTQPFDSFFIILSLFISPLPLLTLILSIFIYAIYYQDWRTFRFWLSLCFTNAIIIFLLTRLVDIPTPNSILRLHTSPSFPIIELTFATSLFGFLIFYINTHYRTVFTLIMRILLLIILFLTGFAPIYMGDNWITSVMASYFIGLTLCLLHWFFYRRCGHCHQRSQLPLVLICLVLTLVTSVSYLLYFKKLVHEHSPNIEQYVMTQQVWWNQKQPLLPVYSTNRIGKRVGLLNIQYAGSIASLQRALERSGWKHQSNSFFYTLLMRAGGHNSAEELPLMTQLYQNRKPTLMMTYNANDTRTSLVFRLWRSNYHLRNYQQPLWIGSVIPRPELKGQHRLHQPIEAYTYIVHALGTFKINQIRLPNRYLLSLPHPSSPVLLIIKDSTLEVPIKPEEK